MRFPDEAYEYAHSGEVNVTDAAVQLPDVDCAMVMFKGGASNTGTVYLGGPGVTVPDGSADTTSGWPIAANGETPWIPVRNLNKLYVIGSVSGDDLSYLLVK